MDFGTSPRIERHRMTQLGSTNIADEDRISKLPDDIIIHILSFLSTENTIPTGVLSKRWTNMWKKVQNLKFSDKEKHTGFEENVTSALLSYQNPFLSSLAITVSYQCDPMDLVIWIGIAFSKRVSKLVLRLNQMVDTVTFPNYLLRRTNALKVLKLMGNMNFDLMSLSVFLGCLKELHLYNVRFENEVSVVRLLDGCPVLQDLVLNIYISSGVHIFVIHVPSLLRLTLATYNCKGEYFVANTPRLNYLNIRNLDGGDYFTMDNAPELKEATICRHDKKLYDNILSSITSVHCLALSAPLKSPANTFFGALTSLEIDTMPEEWCNLLSYMLNRSPNLQFLKLVGGGFTRLSTTWVEQQMVAHCLSTHLQTIEWEDYVWEGSDDIEVAIYLLKNARHLEKATFTTLQPNTSAHLQQRHEVLTRLINTQCASPSCHVALKDSTTWTRCISYAQDPDIEEFTV